MNAKQDLLPNKIYHVCLPRKKLNRWESQLLSEKSNSLWLLFFKCSHFFFKIPKINHIRNALLTWHKHEYLQYPKMCCQFRCLNYRYKSDILILNETWHQCEQSIVISEQIIIQQYIIVLIFELIILFKIINVKFRNSLVNHKPLINTTLVGTFPKSNINIKISKFQ